MDNFLSFLKEVKLTPKGRDQAIEIFVRLIQRKTGERLHRYGGPTGMVEIKGGLGILFLTKSKRAYRFNITRGNLTSIAVWKSYKLGQPGDFTVDFKNLNLAQGGAALVDYVVNPTTGRHTVDVFADINEEALDEQRFDRISPEDFIDLVGSSLLPGQNLRAMTWEDLEAIAHRNGYSVPYGVRRLPRRNKRVDITQLVAEIEVKSGDNVNGKLGDQKKVQALKRGLNAGIHTPSQEQVKEMARDPNKLFGIMADLTRLVARNNRKALLIYGGPGIGKTFVVNQTLEQEGLQKNRHWFVVKGRITTAALYLQLFLHRKGSVLVFDDTDSVWGDKEAANILKAALDSYEDRTISWYSRGTRNVSRMSDEEKEAYNETVDAEIIDGDGEDKIKLPSEFQYNGRIIFISNLSHDKFDSAVLTRSAKIDMTLTTEEIFLRMEGLLEHLGDKSVPREAKLDIIQFLREKADNNALSEVSLRTYVAAEDLYKSGLDNWKELLDYV